MSIPKIIHYCWFGGNPLPEDAKRYIESWKKFCPDYQIIEWNEETFDLNSVAYVKEAYEEKKWAFITDYVRLFALDKMGGVYMDTDVEVLKNLDAFLDDEGFSGFEREDAILTGIMAAEKDNPFINELLHEYDDIHFRRADGTLDLTTNVTRITNCALKHGLKLDNSEQNFWHYTIYPKDYFCPKDYVTGQILLTENTYTIHHFSGSWHSPRQKKWQKFEQSVALKIGHSRMEKLRKTVVWRGAGVVYTKGMGYCLKRLTHSKA
ncbi:glycosyltransferase family 32 protein [Gemmiger formicilis]